MGILFDRIRFINESEIDEKDKLRIELKSKGGSFYDIMNNDKKVGKVGLSFYEDIKAVGIGSLEINSSLRGQGLGTAAIKYIIKTYKKDYDLIYCYVDPKNTGAINLYKRLGKVHDKQVNDDGYYYVEFYNKTGKEW